MDVITAKEAHENTLEEGKIDANNLREWLIRSDMLIRYYSTMYGTSGVLVPVPTSNSCRDQLADELKKLGYNCTEDVCGLWVRW